MGCDYTRVMVNYIDEGFNGWRGPEGRARRKGMEDNAAALHFANLQVYDTEDE